MLKSPSHAGSKICRAVAAILPALCAWQRTRIFSEPLEPRTLLAVNFSITNAIPVPEGDLGQSPQEIFQVTRSGNTAAAAEVSYATQDGTAIAGSDYVFTGGNLQFAPGQLSATIDVSLIGNNVLQGNRTFSVKLSSPNVIPAFASQQTFVVGTAPYSVALADLNGDGKPDVIVANRGSNNITVLLNTTPTGSTTPSFAAQQTFAVGTHPDSVAVADVNGDGKRDIVVANNGSNTVSVLLNTDSASGFGLAAQQTFATGTGPRSVAVADLNGDGKPEIIVANSTANSLSVLLNSTASGATSASFAAQQTMIIGSDPVSVAVGDLNGDGSPDLVVADKGSNNGNAGAYVVVVMNRSAAQDQALDFTSGQTFTTSRSPSAVTIADFNGDGKPDILVTNTSPINSESVLLNSTAPGATSGSFAAPASVTTGQNPYSIAAADLNGDGRPDLIVANSSSAGLTVIPNGATPQDNTATLPVLTLGTGATPLSVAAGDLNGDGQPDLVVANSGSSSVSVLINTTVTLTNLNLGAATIFSAKSIPISVTAADVDGDGKPDLIVANYGSKSVSVLQNQTAPGASTPAFGGQVTFAVGTDPASVTSADVNGDGKPDLIVANRGSNTISLLLNTTSPGGTPSFAAQQTFAAGTNPYSVAAADVNGDGKPDLIVANFGAATVSVLLNATTAGSTTAGFAAQQTFAVGTNPRSVAVADVNGDGKPDLIIANKGSNSVSVLRNTTTAGSTTASFAAQQTFATGLEPYGVAVADLNGDGKPDLIAANFDGADVSVLLSTTKAGATTIGFAAQQTFAAGTGPGSVTLADVNRDGLPDLLVANLASNSVSVLLNTTPAGAATASFDPQQTFATIGSSPASIAAADFNGDGLPNLVVSDEGASSVSVLLNASTLGTNLAFAAQQTVAAGAGPYAVAAADLNGDGKPDLVVANGSQTISVLLNTSTPGSTPSFAAAKSISLPNAANVVSMADLNGDGKPDLVLASQGSDIVIVLLNTTAPGGTTPSFSSAQTFGVGSLPESIAATDLNGDGKLDLVVANFLSNNISVLLNSTSPGSTTASFAAQQTFAAGSEPESVTVADLNGDGKRDLVVADYSPAGLSVLLNTTTPGSTVAGFAAAQTFAAGGHPYSVAAADVNGDGKPDLIIANKGTYTVSVLLNTTTPGSSTPGFAAQQTFAVGVKPTSVALTDANGDGKPDIIVANGASDTVSVLLNVTAAGSAAPSFATQQTFAAGGSGNPQALAVADLNGDGLPDLIFADGMSGNGVSILAGTRPSAAPTFGAESNFVAGGSPYGVAVADVNGDGKPDLVVADRDTNGVDVLLNTTASGATTPSFAAQQTFATGGSQPYSLAIADLNGDGKPDVVVANFGSNSVTVLENGTATGSTTVMFLSGTYATGSLPYSVTVADVNGDGKPDIVVANLHSNSVSVLLNAPVNFFTLDFLSQQTFSTGAGTYPRSVAVADVNGDGKPDLIVADVGITDGPSTMPVVMNSNVQVMLNTTANGSTTLAFGIKQTFAAGNSPTSIAVADVNGDGKPDLIVANAGSTYYASASISVLLNTTNPFATTPSFSPQEMFATGSRPYHVAVADLNGDGRPDLIVESRAAGALSVLINNGAGGFAAQQTFGQTFTTVTVADLNGDGTLDLIGGSQSGVSVLLNPASSVGSPATGTILDDDAPAGISLDSSSASTQSAAVGTTFSMPLAVDIKNAAGDLVQGDNITFTITPATNGASGTFTGGVSTITVATNSSGVASVPFTANGIAGSYTVTATALDSNNNPTSVTTTFNLTNTGVTTPVSVTSVVVNGNNPALAGVQRSMVSSIVYTFSGAVTLAATSAFTLAVHSGQTGTVPMLAWSAISPNPDGSSTQWVVTFSGTANAGPSIDDGVYDITLNTAAVTSDANHSAPITARPTDTFYRLFGDIAGTARVNNADYNQFLNTYNLKSGQAGYQPAFDSTGVNAKISNLDYNLFLNNYNVKFSGFTPTI